MIMGCYGLGVGRTVAAAVEQSHDDDGIIWPVPIAPFEVVVTLASAKTRTCCRRRATSTRSCSPQGIDVLFDDRDERPGVKFKDADLIGFPLRIAVGAKSLANGHDRVELPQGSRSSSSATPADVIETVASGRAARV